MYVQGLVHAGSRTFTRKHHVETSQQRKGRKCLGYGNKKPDLFSCCSSQHVRVGRRVKYAALHGCYKYKQTYLAGRSEAYQPIRHSPVDVCCPTILGISFCNPIVGRIPTFHRGFAYVFALEVGFSGDAYTSSPVESYRVRDLSKRRHDSVGWHYQ